MIWQIRLTRDEAETAVAARNFLVELFQSASPYLWGNGTPSVLDIVDAGVQRAELELQDQPKLQSYLLEALGSSYATLGHNERATAILRKAFVAARTVESRSAMTQQIALDLAELIAKDQPSSQEAGSLLEQVIDQQTKASKDNQPLLARALVARGFNEFMSQEGSKSIVTMGAAVESAEEHDNPTEISVSLESLAYSLAGMRRDLEAIAIYREVLAARIRIFGAHSLPVARIQHVMSLPLSRAGYLSEAASLLGDARTIAYDFLGPGNPDYAEISLRYGSALVLLNRTQEAEGVVDEAVAAIRADSEAETLQLADAYCIVSQLNYAQGKFSLARERAAESLSIYRSIAGADDLRFIAASTTYAISEFGSGDYARAEHLLRGLVSMERRKNLRFIVPVLDYLGRALRATGRFYEAAQMHRSATSIGVAQSGDLGVDGLQAKMQLAIDEMNLGDYAAAHDDAEVALSALSSKAHTHSFCKRKQSLLKWSMRE